MSNRLESSIGVSPFGIIFLSISDLLLMARVAPPLDVIANIVEVVEMPTNVATRLIDLLVGSWVGVLWWLVRVDNKVAPRPPMEILAAALKMTSSKVIGATPPWTRISI